MSFPEPEDPRARYGLEPDPPEEVARLAELVPGADELHRPRWRPPLVLSVEEYERDCQAVEKARRDVEREG